MTLAFQPFFLNSFRLITIVYTFEFTRGVCLVNTLWFGNRCSLTSLLISSSLFGGIGPLPTYFARLL
jgi:hypothetical protein